LLVARRSSEENNSNNLQCMGKKFADHEKRSATAKAAPWTAENASQPRRCGDQTTQPLILLYCGSRKKKQGHGSCSLVREKSTAVANPCKDLSELEHCGLRKKHCGRGEAPLLTEFAIAGRGYQDLKISDKTYDRDRGSQTRAQQT